jgi:HPt (histidine-containing phosphotransfer) domain-containing protein
LDDLKSEKGHIMGQTMKTKKEWSMEPLYSTLGGDPDLGDLVTLFVDEMAERVANIMDLLNRCEWEGLRRAAHQIKGAAGSYGFSTITSCAGKLEFAIRDQAPEENIRQATEELVSMCNRARAGVPQDS